MIIYLQCNYAICNVCVHAQMHVYMRSVCTNVSLFTSFSMCHANVQVDVQCTQVCVDVITGCARASEMKKGVSVDKHVHM